MPLTARNQSICRICSSKICINDIVKPFQEINNGVKISWVHGACIDAFDERIPICKHVAKHGHCMYGNSCNFRHPSDCGLNITLSRQRNGTWARRRVYNDGKVGIFRRWLLTVFGASFLCNGSGVLDIAGGKGETSFELLNMNDIPCSVIDPRPLDLRRYHKKYARGYYHRNEILMKFNKLPIQMNTLDNGEVAVNIRQPNHIRCFFHMTSLIDTCMPCYDDIEQIKAMNSRPQCILNKELFEFSIQFAKNSSWTTKGLIHNDSQVSETTRDLDATVEDTLSANFVYDNRQVHIANHSNYIIESYETARDIIYNASIIIGMHPDQATEHMIDYAIANNKPFAVIPCCIYSKQFPSRICNGKLVTTYAEFVQYLINKAPMDIHAVEMSFEGKCVLLYYIPTHLRSLITYDPAMPLKYITKGLATTDRIRHISDGIIDNGNNGNEVPDV